MKLLDRIRAATHESHERLHKHPVTSPLVSSMLGLSHYRLVIAAFDRFYTALAIQTPDIFVQHLNLSALRKDVAALDIKTDSLAPCKTLPTIAFNTDSVLGMLYVIEGSRMGGQMIARNVKQTLYLDETSGLAFFTGDGRDTVRNWKCFMQRIEKECKDYEDCITAAEQTFLSLERWLWIVWNEDQTNTPIIKQREQV